LKPSGKRWRSWTIRILQRSLMLESLVKFGIRSSEFGMKRQRLALQKLRIPHSELRTSTRQVLLVFTQSGCSSCRELVPELNRLQSNGDRQVLVVNNGEAETTREWACQVSARFPVLVQQDFFLSKRYEVFTTPFAFLIDEQGLIASKGIVNSRQHLGFVLGGARSAVQSGRRQVEAIATE
jgi:thiol-disulfide isomerase/thioredoxin